MLTVLCLSALASAEEPPPSPPAAPVEAAPPVEAAAPVEPAEPSAPAEPAAPTGLLGVTEAERAAYSEGRRLGVEAARAEGLLTPALVAGAIGFGFSAPTVLLVGPCCGAPVLSVAALAPGVYVGGRDPAMPEAWTTGDPSYDLAFQTAYVGTLRQRKTRAMLIFGITGAAAGTAVGMVATKLLLDEWGYTW
jgi:hypothetical protein